MKTLQHIRYYGILLLVVVYSCMPLKPVLPFAGDFIAHTFNEFDHVATVHFENGKYHVHDEVKKNAESGKTDPEAPINETNLKIDLHCVPGIVTTFSEASIFDSKTSVKIVIHSQAFFNGRSVSPDYPPPQVL
ncbi:MAG TPA: hypothetical protein VK151_00555 [Fluviicola sp.]|nr:hypothetical protein [Fluviicola sp.]